MNFPEPDSLSSTFCSAISPVTLSKLFHLHFVSDKVKDWISVVLRLQVACATRIRCVSVKTAGLIHPSGSGGVSQFHLGVPSESAFERTLGSFQVIGSLKPTSIRSIKIIWMQTLGQAQCKHWSYLHGRNTQHLRLCEISSLRFPIPQQNGFIINEQVGSAWQAQWVGHGTSISGLSLSSTLGRQITFLKNLYK